MIETASELYGHCLLLNDLNGFCIGEVLAFAISLRHIHVIDVYIPPASFLNNLSSISSLFCGMQWRGSGSSHTSLLHQIVGRLKPVTIRDECESRDEI